MTRSQIDRLLTPRLMVLLDNRTVVCQIVDDVFHYIQHNGPSWFVTRMKVMKIALSGYIVGESLGSQPNLRLVQGRPKGVWKYIFKRALIPEDSERMLQVVNLYTAFVSKAPTLPQVTKFFDSVTKAGGPVHDFPGRMAEQAKRRFSNLFLRVAPRNVALAKELLYPLGDAKLSSNRRHPLGTKTFPETERYLDTFLYTSSWEESRKLFMEVSLGVMFWRTLAPYDKYCMYAAQSELAFEDSGPFHVGHISFLQEPGFKLRAIANPGRIWQHTLAPLKHMLWTCLKEVPWDTTFDQQAGVRWTQKQLAAGKTVHSVDLSDATNHFPLALQEAVLKSFPRVFHPGLVKLFTMLSCSPWYVPERIRRQCESIGFSVPETVQWSRGQPLGLGPSFASFALAHGVLVDTLRQELGIPGIPFRILGDDIVIADDRLFEAYTQALKSLNIPTSKLKTWSSSNRAEFAGCAVFRDRSFHLGKWRTITDDSFLDICRRLKSPASLQLLKPRQRVVATMILSLPRDLGGEGWNPDGLPLSDRVSRALSWLDSLVPHQGEPLAGLTRGVKQRQFLENSEIAKRFSFLTGMLIPARGSAPSPEQDEAAKSRHIDQMRRIGLSERIIPITLRAPFAGTLRARLQNLLDEGYPRDKLETLSYNLYRGRDDEALLPSTLVSLERKLKIAADVE